MSPIERLSQIASHVSLFATTASANPPSSKAFDLLAGKVPKTSLQKTEAKLRVELAAAYRIVAHLGWSDGIQNHLTLKVPGETNQYLINSYGMGFEEVTASSLVKIDHDGNVIDPGSVAGSVNLAGFNIHGAIHKARADAVCVIHTHEANVAAVASMNCGLMRGLSQHSLLCGQVAHHKYGLTTGRNGIQECELMAADLGTTARIMLLENHGVITIGATVAEAMMRLWYITKAAEIQVLALSANASVGAVNVITDEFTLKQMAKGGTNFFNSLAEAEFAHHCRVMDRVNPGYDDLLRDL